MSQFSAEHIHELHRAAIGLMLDRRTLLAGLPPEFVACLQVVDSPGAQLLTDLHQLNTAGILLDGSNPFEVWLQNARHLSATRQESDIFEHYLQRLNHPRSPKEDTILRPPTEETSPRGRTSVSIEAEGDIHEFDDHRKTRAESELRRVTGDANLKIVRVRSGSIIFELDTSDEAADVLIRLAESGELKTLLGYNIRHVSTGGSNVRTAQIKQHNSSLQFKSQVKLLFLAANPVDTARLALDQEARLISQHLRACRLGHQVQLVHRWAVQPDDILQAMNEDRPNIVHFSGHGCSTGELRFADKNGLSKAVEPATLRRVFQVFRDHVQVVVLNACYSAKQARAISGLIDCTVGMSRDISDTAAIAFAASFYRGIGFGVSVQEAFDQGVLSICLEGHSVEHRIPRLHSRKGVDPSAFRLCI